MKTFSTLTRAKPVRALGVDPSSRHIAFAIVEKNGDHVSILFSGKIELSSGDIFMKMQECFDNIQYLINEYRPEIFIVEQPISIQNPQTTRILTYIVGSLIVGAMQLLKNIYDVNPMVWKAHLGYKMVSANEKKVWKIELGEKEARKKADFEKKERVKRILRDRFSNFDDSDHDVCDAIGIALYGADNYVRR